MRIWIFEAVCKFGYKSLVIFWERNIMTCLKCTNFLHRNGRIPFNFAVDSFFHFCREGSKTVFFSLFCIGHIHDIVFKFLVQIQLEPIQKCTVRQTETAIFILQPNFTAPFACYNQYPCNAAFTRIGRQNQLAVPCYSIKGCVGLFDLVRVIGIGRKYIIF